MGEKHGETELTLKWFSSQISSFHYPVKKRHNPVGAGQGMKQGRSVQLAARGHRTLPHC